MAPSSAEILADIDRLEASFKAVVVRLGVIALFKNDVRRAKVEQYVHVLPAQLLDGLRVQHRNVHEQCDAIERSIMLAQAVHDRDYRVANKLPLLTKESPVNVTENTNQNPSTTNGNDQLDEVLVIDSPKLPFQQPNSLSGNLSTSSGSASLPLQDADFSSLLNSVVNPSAASQLPTSTDSDSLNPSSVTSQLPTTTDSFNPSSIATAATAASSAVPSATTNDLFAFLEQNVSNVSNSSASLPSSTVPSSSDSVSLPGLSGDQLSSLFSTETTSSATSKPLDTRSSPFMTGQPPPPSSEPDLNVTKPLPPLPSSSTPLPNATSTTTQDVEPLDLDALLASFTENDNAGNDSTFPDLPPPTEGLSSIDMDEFIKTLGK